MPGAAASLLLAVVIAGCGGSGATAVHRPAATRQAGPPVQQTGASSAESLVQGAQAGSSSPQAVWAGVLQGLVTGDTGLVCQYAEPDEQSLCVLSLSGETVTPNGPLHVGHVVVQGSQAIVSMTGNVCISDGDPAASVCGANQNPSEGLPTAGVTFDQAYSASINSSPDPKVPAFWTLACDELNGKWYIGG